MFERRITLDGHRHSWLHCEARLLQVTSSWAKYSSRGCDGGNEHPALLTIGAALLRTAHQSFQD